MSVLNRFRRLSLVLVGSAALAACGLVPALDDAVIEQSIRDGVQQQTGITLTEVECPTSRPIQQGDVFTCSAVADDGRVLEISVTQDDAQGNVSWEVTNEFYPTPAP
jgi:hypothetical protein